MGSYDNDKLYNYVGPVKSHVSEENDDGTKTIDLEVDLDKLPIFRELASEVQKVVENATWWEKYGDEWVHILTGVPLFWLGLILLAEDSILSTMFGIFILGSVHAVWTYRAAHLASHDALAESKTINWICQELFFGVMGPFSTDAVMDGHIKVHHPHTNIIGLGDSSSWKAPFLGTYIYLYLAPLAIPILTPFVSLAYLVEIGLQRKIPKFLVQSVAGTVFFVWLMSSYTGHSWWASALLTCAYRAVYALPWIHVNIFQHIGLPMYARTPRPARLYQMSSGVLNLASNPILDHAFGHCLISCHVEHHLFPHLSDNMCLRVKPLVRRFLKSHDLPYHEANYLERLQTFTIHYDEYMVKAPPITRFVGIQ